MAAYYDRSAFSMRRFNVADQVDWALEEVPC